MTIPDYRKENLNGLLRNISRIFYAIKETAYLDLLKASTVRLVVGRSDNNLVGRLADITGGHALINWFVDPADRNEGGDPYVHGHLIGVLFILAAVGVLWWKFGTVALEGFAVFVVWSLFLQFIDRRKRE